MGNYYSRRKSRKHITTVAFIILLLLLFLFLYAKASSSSFPGIHHHSTQGSFMKKPGVLDPKPHDLHSSAASRGSRIYTNEGGDNVFEDGKRRVFTGPNPLHNRGHGGRTLGQGSDGTCQIYGFCRQACRELCCF